MRLRSALYMPGANERALEKAKGLDADALILDLEDAVSPTAKAQARERVCAAASSGDYAGRVVAIRINAIGTAWHDDDLAAAAAAGPEAIVLPKVESAEDVRVVADRLDDGGTCPDTRLWAMLETPAAVLRAEQIAQACDRLTVLVIGTNDLANELHASVDAARSPLLASLSWCVLAARSTGRLILDGVYNDVRDPIGFEAECRQGHALGFDGKTLIHPGQLEICNRVWSPSPDEVEHARRVIAAFELAQRDGSGVATVDGRLIENLHVDGARRVLSLLDDGA